LVAEIKHITATSSPQVQAGSLRVHLLVVQKRWKMNGLLGYGWWC